MKIRKVRRTLIAAALVAGLSLPVSVMAVDRSELPTPIVELMPHVQKLGDSLNLTAEQKKTLDAWMAEAPARREALEDEYLAIRAELREAILKRDERLNRERLIAHLAEKDKQLTQMRSLCARMLEDTLSAEQYQKVVESYRSSL
ncbi:MAG: hypothetical protein ACP5DC_02720 [Halothiobacillaceae bacterium]